jgi:hypothetical protein
MKVDEKSLDKYVDDTSFYLDDIDIINFLSSLDDEK